MPEAKASTIEDGDLIKGSQPAVYFFKENKRFAFPNEQVFYSWFKGFEGIKSIEDTELQEIALSGNITFRPGTALLKIQTDPKVYAIDNGNALHWIQTEKLASELYGSDWAKKVSDVSDALFVDYIIGKPFASVEDHNAQSVANAYDKPSIVLYSRRLVEVSHVNYALPPNTQITVYYLNCGYHATTSLDMTSLAAWYSDRLDDGTLLYDYGFSYASEDIRMMNFGSSMSGSFRHRSVTLIGSEGKGKELKYCDVTYPVGLISYPYAHVGDSPSVHEKSATYSFVTDHKPAEVVKWYQDNGPKYGYGSVVYQKGETNGTITLGEGLSLKSDDGLREIGIGWDTDSGAPATSFIVIYKAQ